MRRTAALAVNVAPRDVRLAEARLQRELDQNSERTPDGTRCAGRAPGAGGGADRLRRRDIRPVRQFRRDLW